MRLIPNSGGEDDAPSPLREFNPCHTPAGSPQGGQFCSHTGPITAGEVDLARRAATIRAEATTDAERQHAHLMAHAEADLEALRASGQDTMQRYFKNGQWTPAREREHDRIISDYFAAAEKRLGRPLSQDLAEPTVIVLAGMPGAGKSTATERLDTRDAIIADSDALKKHIPEYTGRNAALVHGESAYLADLIVEIALARRMNVVIDGTMKTVGKVGTGVRDGALGKLQAFKEAGFRTEAILVDVDVNQSIANAVTRFATDMQEKGTGRYVPPGMIRSDMVLPDGTPKPRASFAVVRDAKLPGTNTYLLDAWSAWEGWTGVPKPPKLLGSRGTHRMLRKAA